MRLLTHVLLLTSAIMASSLIAKTSLHQYDLTIAAALFIVLFFLKRVTLPSSELAKMAESVVFTAVTVYIVMATGKSASPFFFLLYFLLFSLSLLLEPAISLTTTLVLIMILISSLDQQPTFSALLPIFSLAFLTPFAMLLGQEYFQMQEIQKKEKKEARELQQIHRDLADTLISMEKSVDNLKDSAAKEQLSRDISALRTHVETQ